MGLSDEEFLKETPYSLSLLIERDQQADFKHYHGFAKVVAMLANINRDPKKCPDGFSEADFMPPHLLPPSQRKNKPMKPDRETGNVSVTKLKDVNQRDFLFQMFKCGIDSKGKVVRKPKKQRIVKAQ